MRYCAVLLLLLCPAPVLAQHAGHEGHDAPAGEAQTRPVDPHAGHGARDEDTASIPLDPPPPEALAGPAHAADTLFAPSAMAAARTATHHETGGMIARQFALDRLEWQAGRGADALVWDANAWIGDDTDKLWLESAGSIAESGSLAEAEFQALWSHAISEWFDVRAGVRHDFRPRPQRTHLALGMAGLAPYFIAVDLAAYLSHKGDVTARIEAEYDQRITQRLVAQPRVELELAAQDVPELGLGAGFASVTAGLRLRYEIVRELAPYVGVEWRRDLGDTAEFTRLAGDKPGRTVFVAGVRAWF